MKDIVEPEGKWIFDSDVTDAFDDMLARSIPQYEVMRTAITDVGARYLQPDTTLLDIGCSRGEALRAFMSRFRDANRYVGLEVSQPMLEAARARFEGNSYNVRIERHDLREGIPENIVSSVTLSVLTLQFVPIEYRQALVRSVYERLLPGGAFVVVEKVLGDTAEINALLVDLYYERKAENGYSQDAIERKRLSLEGVLVPVTARWNVELLERAGFAQIDCFWRFLNFAGWLAVKS